MWVWRFYGCHKTAIEGDCFLPLHCFPASVSVWDMRFSSHAVHGSMLKVLLVVVDVHSDPKKPRECL